VRGTGPLRDRRNLIAESRVVYLVDEDAEESGRLTVRVRLELGLDLDDECGGHGGEQTSLYAGSVDLRARNIRNPQRLAWCSGPRHAS